VLCVHAHPDDVDFWAAGTVASWVAAGAQVTYLLVTAGDAGGFDPTVPRGRIAQIRRAEQMAAGSAIGVRDIRFLTGYADGEVEASAGLTRDIVRQIRQTRPQRILTHSPSRTWEDFPASHPDHLAVGEAVARAVYPFARNPFAFPELAEAGLGPWTVHELWLQGDPAPNTAWDVTAVYPAREAALAAHASQHPDPAAMRAKLRADLERNAARSALPPGRLAEAFRTVHIA
jgi:LmbE family N-acetylglucosaminyl deacetylase